jgi:hypothetical protein
VLGVNFYIWIAIAVTSAAVGAGAAWKVQEWRLDSAKAETKLVQSEYDQFVTKTEAAGKIAEAEKKATIAADKLREGNANAENARTTAALRSDIKRLRGERDQARAGSSIVPAAAHGAANPETACFDRPELERALRGFIDQIAAGTRILVDEGSQATIDLDSAKLWAQDLTPKPGEATDLKIPEKPLNRSTP